jgi:hypothetical protein
VAGCVLNPLSSCLFFPSGPVLYCTAPCKWGQPCWSGPTSQQLIRRRKHVFASRRNHGFIMIRAPTASRTGNRKVIALTRKRDGSHAATLPFLAGATRRQLQAGTPLQRSKGEGTRCERRLRASFARRDLLVDPCSGGNFAVVKTDSLLSCLLHRKKKLLNITVEIQFPTW